MYGEMRKIFGCETLRFTKRVGDNRSYRDVDDIAAYASTKRRKRGHLLCPPSLQLTSSESRASNLRTSTFVSFWRRSVALEAAVQRHEEMLQSRCPPDVPVQPAAQPLVQSTPAQPTIPNDARARAAAPSSSREQADDHSWASVAGHLSYVDGRQWLIRSRGKQMVHLCRVVRGKKPVDTGSSSAKAVRRRITALLVNLQPGHLVDISGNVIWVTSQGLVVNMYINFRCLQYYNTVVKLVIKPIIFNSVATQPAFHSN